MTSLLRRQQTLSAVLVGVALALVVLVFTTRDKMTTSEAEARGNNLLQYYDETEITRIEFERQDSSFVLLRTKMDDAGQGTWTIKKPVEEDVEPFSIQKLTGSLEFSSALRRIKPEEVNRAAFGLDSPDLVIHIDMGEIKYRLRFGKEAASPAGARYLEIAGENAPNKSIVLVSKSLATELMLKLDDFRERYVMPYLSTSLAKVELEGAGGTRKLRRGDWPDGFRFDGMLGDVRTSRAALDRVLVQFARTRADQFMDPNVAEAAQKAGDTVTVTMTPTDKAQKVGVVVVGGACPGSSEDVVALRKEPERAAACVPHSVLSGLTTPSDALVDRTLFWMRPDEVEGFEVKQGELRLALDRKDTGFVIRAPHEGTVDAEAGNGRLEAILHATGTIVENPDLKQLGLDPPTGSVSVHSAAAEDSKVREETVSLSAPTPDGTVYARRAQDGIVLALGREAARALVADSSLVRSRNVLDVPLADVSKVQIDGAVPQVVERKESGVLSLVAPAGFDIDSVLALELCDALRGVTAERWVADKDDGTFGLSPASLTAHLETTKDGKAEGHVLRIGNATGSGFYAQMDGDPGVFVASRRLRETLTTLVLDRSVTTMDPQIASKVTLTTDARTVVLEKRGDDFVETDPGAPLSADATHRLVDTLTALRAEAAVSVGPARREEGLEKPLLTVRVDNEPGHPEKPRFFVFSVGAGDSWRGISIHYARVDGISATYALPRSAVQTLVDAL
jgi:hypothetical protein